MSIPKCASRSVQHALGLPAPRDRSDVGDPGIIDNHAPWDVVKLRYGEAEYAARFKFCFVRNPWDRCVSWYSYHQKLAPYNRMSFTDWVMAGLPHHWHWQNETCYGPTRTPLVQHRFFTDSALHAQVDFVGRLETIDADIAEVARIIGLPFQGALKRLNASRTPNGADYRAFYNDRTADTVRILLADDIKLLGYQF